MTPQSPQIETDEHVDGRRGFLGRAWFWLRWLAAGAILYPVLRFVTFEAPRKPRFVKVDKVVPIGGFAVEQEFILFVDKNGPWAVSRKCTHLGCRLNFLDQERILLCPCHQSKFTPSGERIAGPAKKNLPRYEVAVMNQQEGKGYIVTL